MRKDGGKKNYTSFLLFIASSKQRKLRSLMGWLHSGFTAAETYIRDNDN